MGYITRQHSSLKTKCQETSSLTNSLLRLGCDVDNLGSLWLTALLLVILHKRESEHLLDGVVVGEEHDHAVNTHAPTTGRRETELEGLAKGLVDELGLVVALLLLVGLLLEAQALVKGIVQLGVGVDDFLFADKGLEALAQAGRVAVVFGQRRHHLRVSGDHGGVDTLFLDELADELVEHARVGQRRRALRVGLLEHALEKLVGLLGVQRVARWEFLAASLFQGGDHLDALPGLGPVDLVDLAGLGVEFGLVAACDFLDQVGDEVFGQVHDVVDVGKGLVELAGGEFGVVGQVDAFVTELAADFVDAFQTADNQLLEVQFWGNAHEELHVQLVVVGLEGLGCGSTGNGVHHGSLDLDEIALVKVAADVADHLGAGDEGLAGIVVHDQIEISLPVTLLLILETVVLVGELVQAGSEESDFLSKDTQLTLISVARSSTAGVTLDADNVTSAERLVLVGEGLAAGGFLRLAHDLHSGALGADIVEAEVGARGTLVVDTATDADDLFLLVLASLEVTKVLDEVSDVIVDVELVGVGVGVVALAELLDGSAADLKVLLGTCQSACSRFCS